MLSCHLDFHDLMAYAHENSLGNNAKKSHTGVIKIQELYTCEISTHVQ